MAKALGAANTDVPRAAPYSVLIQLMQPGSHSNLRITNRVNTAENRLHGRKNERNEMLQMRHSDAQIHDGLPAMRP
jgi:hypothetical protein